MTRTSWRRLGLTGLRWLISWLLIIGWLWLSLTLLARALMVGWYGLAGSAPPAVDRWYMLPAEAVWRQPLWLAGPLLATPPTIYWLSRSHRSSQPVG